MNSLTTVVPEENVQKSVSLSVFELLRRTIGEIWQDDVFGQAGRLAFYHFIALFPALLMLLVPLAHLAQAGSEMRHLLSGSFQQFLPRDAAELVGGAIHDLAGSAHSSGRLLAVACCSAVWAGINASWAMIVGLNTAYETEEDRDWPRIIGVAACLALGVLLLVFTALLTARFAGDSFRGADPSHAFVLVAQWAAIAAILLVCFCLFYRFGPNLKSCSWRWSMPGAIFGASLWLVSTLLVREYFNHFSPYHTIYGRASAPAMLLMWLYMTSATVLIGAELNSEIEKTREQAGAEQPMRHSRRPI
jgi:membrane protein